MKYDGLRGRKEVSEAIWCDLLVFLRRQPNRSKLHPRPSQADANKHLLL